MSTEVKGPKHSHRPPLPTLGARCLGPAKFRPTSFFAEGEFPNLDASAVRRSSLVGQRVHGSRHRSLPWSTGPAGQVGAGLPVMTMLRRMVTSGDPIAGVSGCFSGTLGYVMSGLEPGPAAPPPPPPLPPLTATDDGR